MDTGPPLAVVEGRRAEQGPDAHAAAVAARLGLEPGSAGARYFQWLAQPAFLDATLEPLDPARVRALCQQLGFDSEDTADVVATFPSPSASSDWWWCTQRAVALLCGAIGDIDAPHGDWPHFEGPGHDIFRRCHFLHVALYVAPSTVAYLRAAGVPEGLAWRTLRDIGRHVRIHRRMHGITGIDADWWASVSLRGELVELGRLQFNRFTLGVGDESPPWYPADEAERRGEAFRPGDQCLGVHVPEGAPLADDLVADSLQQASTFFSRCFPSRRRRVATCRSWLLDPQLRRYLGPRSNIALFQARFELVPEAEPGDDDVLEFVFRVRPADLAGAPGIPGILDTLPQRTTMERAVVSHLRAGGHWERRTGWLEIPGL